MGYFKVHDKTIFDSSNFTLPCIVVNVDGFVKGEVSLNETLDEEAGSKQLTGKFTNLKKRDQIFLFQANAPILHNFLRKVQYFK